MTTDADKLRDQLARLGISQRGLARELDLDERLIRRFCAGELPVPKVVWLSIEALAKRKPKGRAP